MNLAPTSDADDTGIYAEALSFATKDDQVLNIALTGPYGSGKSSVIKSFLLKYRRPFLQLSLASFLPDGDATDKPSKQEIERSILQQILYGADADRLPMSRFKRIQVPKRLRSMVTSGFFSLGLLCGWYLLNKQTELMSGALLEPLEPSNWFNLMCIVVVAAFILATVHSLYLRSFGLSLKSISLKDVQIAPDATDKESILNRHLDEIIYFFQSTRYDLVVIEDLDRFDTPEIFVALREINGLINASPGVRRRVRFLYALRDDIFVHKDRTKFFEFIVPIIPIINHSNSIDKVIEQGRRIHLDSRVDRRFVREVSRYLDDLRLIRNIFNEYVVYSANLESNEGVGLDPTKLLAVIVYKNVLPRDFAALHRQDGTLSKVLSRYDQYLSKLEVQLRSELSSIAADLAVGDAQRLMDQAELRKVYAMTIVELLPSNSLSVIFEGAQIPIGQLAQSAQLEAIISRKTISVHTTSHGRVGADLSSLEHAVDPTSTFEERSAAIEQKSARFRESAALRTDELKEKVAALRTRKFNEVIRESVELIEEVFAEVGEGRDLLKFLILEGYLDDTYYQYISLFHTGRLSPNDNRFLIRIRSYNTPDPDFQIDNAAEVVASMRPSDFGNSYVLNRYLVDYLLNEESGTQSARLAAACTFIAAHFIDCRDFFLSYYQRGVHVDRLVRALVDRWPGFATVAIDGVDGATHAARIIAYVPGALLSVASNISEPLADYVSRHSSAVLGERVEFDVESLKVLGVRVEDLPSISTYADVMSYVAQEGLYVISIGNINYVLQHLLAWSRVVDLEERHFTALLEANDAILLDHVNSEFETYVQDVLLKLPENTKEDVTAIVRVLQRDDVAQTLREEFLRRQEAKLPTLEDVPTVFHAMVLEEGKCQVTWENCLLFTASDAYDAELLTEYLQRPENVEVLSKRDLPDQEGTAALVAFLVENDDLDVPTYGAYLRKLPAGLSSFPSVEPEKIRELIEERKVVFSDSTFDQLEDEDLQVLFVSLNFAAYVDNKSSYSLDDTFRKKLLATEMPHAQMMMVITDIDQEYVSRDAELASIIGPILDRSPIETTGYQPEFIKAVVLNSRPGGVQISLLNKLGQGLSDSDVREVLRGLGEPFSDIVVNGKTPKIENGELNQRLASWLRERQLISSFSETSQGDGIRIYTFKKEG